MTTTTEATTDHFDHRGHWDANGSGDWHCSEHREPGCDCIGWVVEAVCTECGGPIDHYGCTPDECCH